ncbi:MAG: sulfite exporter TauE/SafE family protein [Hyphomonadaceae bacterium]|nr:sulfite exporter TauE/SafE family protein [Hyphomonadaceae bacterium]
MLKPAALFFLTAALYASVGFGGGSTYNALLVLVGTDYAILPSIALVCNIIVVSGGTWRFHQKGLIPWGRVWPLFALSVPAAWFGGRIPIDEPSFVLLLGVSLLVAGCLMLWQMRVYRERETERPMPRGLPVIGGGLGLLSGMVGIGGGIFLAPILHMMNWGRVKVIAGVCSAFILVNSVSGLIGQAMKLSGQARLSDILSFWPLFVAVCVGGQLGSRAASGWLDPRLVRTLTAVLILFVALRLLWRARSGM